MAQPAKFQMLPVSRSVMSPGVLGAVTKCMASLWPVRRGVKTRMEALSGPTTSRRGWLPRLSSTTWAASSSWTGKALP